MTLCSWTLTSLKLLYQYFWYGSSTTFYRAALQLLRKENILFTKIFQSLAHSESVSPDLRSELQHYTANTSYTESEIDYETLDYLEQNYGIQVDRRVINSGMIALVFKGVDASGQPIIVKLKRRNILQHLQEGCSVVSTLYGYVKYWAPKNLYVRILRPFILNIHEIIDQCDFSTEIANLKQAKEDFEPLAFIQIPTVYNKPAVAPNYILMEHIAGTHVLPPNTTEKVRADYLEKFATFVSYGFLFNAVQHTDLHSGNVLFTENGLGIIDYGMAIQLNDETHDMLLSTAAIIRDRPPLHTIDFIETFKDLFVPRLVKEELTDSVAVEDMCISIAQPLIEHIDFDELNITDNLAKLSVLLGREVILHRDIYKIILGFSMMAGKHMIFGPNYPNTEQIHEIERRGLRNAYALII